MAENSNLIKHRLIIRQIKGNCIYILKHLKNERQNHLYLCSDISLLLYRNSDIFIHIFTCDIYLIGI